MALKPEVSLTLAATTAALVWGIFQMHMPTVADQRANQPNETVDSARRVATGEAAIIVSGIALLAKDPNIFIVGGTMTMIESFVRLHANHVNPATNTIKAPAGTGQPASTTGAAPAA